MNIASSRLNTLLTHVKARFLVITIAGSFVALASVLVMQSIRYDILRTGLLLGWDSPGYVWSATNVIRNGPISMIQYWGFPQLYLQLLAFLGYFSQNVVLIERILPLMFALLLVYTSSQVALKITGNTAIAGLSAIMSVMSLNTLRLLSDLNRNLMALSLGFVTLLLLAGFKDKEIVLSKRYVLVSLVLFVIACTHFETFALLGATLLLQAALIRDYRKVAVRLFSLLIPSFVLIPMLVEKGVFSAWGSEIPIGSSLRADELALWLGGSLFLVPFLLVGILYLFLRSIRTKSQLSQLLLTWTMIILVAVSLIESGIVGFSHAISFRLLLMIPSSLLLSLSALAIVDGFGDLKLDFRIISARKNYLSGFGVRKFSYVLLAILIIGSGVTAVQRAGDYLTPYVSHLTYQKIIEAGQFLKANQMGVPVVLFYGEPALWLASLERLYVGAEIGEHFAYYGEFADLLSLDPAPRSASYSDPTLLDVERTLSRAWFDELQGRIRTQWPHSSCITDVAELSSHPILVVSPDFYSGDIPYYLRPFYIGSGIYVIPPNSISVTPETLYGPFVHVTRDEIRSDMRSEYMNIDPGDPSIVYLMVNASQGYRSYNFTDLQAGWTFVRMVQGGDLSYPENIPARPGGALATEVNDPSEMIADWKMLMNGSMELDSSLRKEGSSSLRIEGQIDSWGNLGGIYDAAGSWDLSEYSSMAVWAKSNESATFSIQLADALGRFRTFFGVKAGGSSATTDWKRFVISIDEYTFQTEGFDINEVDSIFLYVFSMAVGKPISLWVDDLVFDGVLDFEQYIYKGRVLMNDSIIIYFETKEIQMGVEMKPATCE